MKNYTNFCTWADANNFMMECNAFAGGCQGLIDAAQKLESPLELVLLSAIKAAERSMKFRFGQSESIEQFEWVHKYTNAKLVVRPAVPIGVYRADLVMQACFMDDANPAVVIECDGFNYHDKTRDQAIRDRARDRYMQREGYIVARFAGDEIIEQPFACAFDVYDLVLRGIARVHRDAHPAAGWPVFIRGTEGDDSGPMSLEQFYLSADKASESGVK